MSPVLVYERLECRGCRWFRQKLTLEEKLMVPPDLAAEVVGKCECKRDVLLRNNSRAAKRCPSAELKRR
jgi:hypothetical protein